MEKVFCLFFNNAKSQDQSPITLIVNPNINNTYIIGEKCGIKESLVNLYQFNCSISPLEVGGEIILNGNINPLSPYQTKIQILQTNNSTSVLISIVIGDFTLSNSIISNITNEYNGYPSTNYLIYTDRINFTLNNVNIFDIGSSIETVIQSENSILSITNCLFNILTTVLGAISGGSCNVIIKNSVFTSLSSSSGPSVLNYLTSTENVEITLIMKNCQVYNCYSQSNGGVLFMSNYFNSKNVPNLIIENSVLKNNNGSKGGVLYSSKYPLIINNCTFDSNVAGLGSILYVSGGSITVTNSTIINLFQRSTTPLASGVTNRKPQNTSSSNANHTLKKLKSASTTFKKNLEDPESIGE
ncbi:hypothetical protein ACTFIT_009038 [Dictyostelium discoideum]